MGYFFKELSILVNFLHLQFTLRTLVSVYGREQETTRQFVRHVCICETVADWLNRGSSDGTVGLALIPPFTTRACRAHAACCRLLRRRV